MHTSSVHSSLSAQSASDEQHPGVGSAGSSHRPHALQTNARQGLSTRQSSSPVQAASGVACAQLPSSKHRSVVQSSASSQSASDAQQPSTAASTHTPVPASQRGSSHALTAVNADRQSMSC